MRGLIGDRLLKRFAGYNRHSPEQEAVPEAASDHADGEAASSSANRSIGLPPAHPVGANLVTKPEAEAAERHDRA
jgi:hypothetical protein